MPSLRNANAAWWPLAAIAVMCVSPLTRTGTVLIRVWPLPSAPRAPLPHAQTVPSVRNAYPVPAPPATAFTCVKERTGTGTLLFVV